jgi:hypothetical protein
MTTKYVKKQPGFRQARQQEQEEREQEDQEEDQDDQDQEETPEPVAINITDKLVVPDLAQTPVDNDNVKTKTKRRGVKKAETRHKPHTKKVAKSSNES